MLNHCINTLSSSIVGKSYTFLNLHCLVVSWFSEQVYASSIQRNEAPSYPLLLAEEVQSRVMLTQPFRVSN